MKKLFIVLLSLIMLVSCSSIDRESLETYEEMANVLYAGELYNTESSYYDIEIEYISSEDENRFYIVIDNPQIAMYDVKMIAFEEDSQVNLEAAACVGIFGDQVNLVPNQINADNGYAKGISISGTYTSESPVILCLVQWINENNSKVYREFFKFNKSEN